MTTNAIPEDIEWGCNPRTSHAGDGRFKEFVEEFKPIPRKDWEPVSNAHLVWHIFDQADGMCTANGVTQTIMCLRERAGLTRKVLDPANLYGQHSSWGTGSSLEENLEAAVETGVCDSDTIPVNTWPPSKWPKDWKENARYYRIAEWWDLNGNFDYLATALQMGFVCNIGLNWPGGGGHSVAATDLLGSISKGWRIKGPNSWGADYGDNGFYELTEQQCNSAPRYGSFAARSVIYE